MIKVAKAKFIFPFVEIAVCLGFLFLVQFPCSAQLFSSVWKARNENGTYINPILHADFSDPDAVRVGNDYFLVASSFHFVPGLPILHSRDLVNWNIIGYALNKLTPEEHFKKVRPGGGVWAPSIRYYNNQFYIFYPDPDFGIYMMKADSANGPWSEPVLVLSGKGLIDPCPLWDNNGRTYLVYAFAGSRAEKKSIIVVRELSRDGSKPKGLPVIVYDGHTKDPTVEGPKFYQRNGWYYIFAPAGGVSTGWQIVLRSRHVFGPYERRVVLQQGATKINGPHQGAWVRTSEGEDWFLHFQDKGPYGRVLHLQPLTWKDNWPVIGHDPDGDGVGEPVITYQLPRTGTQKSKKSFLNPTASDSFNPLLWQWQANPADGWIYTTSLGKTRMYSVLKHDSITSLLTDPAVLVHKFPSERFIATINLSFYPQLDGERFGLFVTGNSYGGISIVKSRQRKAIIFSTYEADDKNKKEKIDTLGFIDTEAISLRLCVDSLARCRFGYSKNGYEFNYTNKTFFATPGKWVGSTVAILCDRKNPTNDAGFVEIHSFKLEPFIEEIKKDLEK